MADPGSELAEPSGLAGGPFVGFGPGARVAGYLLEEQVGAGGMAVVFRAVDERLGRRVALKILAPGLAADQAFRQRFIRESRAAAAVDDPHIIPVYEAGEAAGVLFIAMRLVPGKDVRSLLFDSGRMSADRVVAIISPVASALDAAHAAGLVHRDVKPANMLVDARPDRPDHVYLSDFGLSKGALSAVGLTGSGQFLGTPAYVSPEQIQGEAVDGRADQYGLACAAHELLTGEPPFPRDQGMAVIWAHLSAPPPSVRALRPELPAAVDPVLARALAKSPQDRYPTCRDFAEALRTALGLLPYKSGPGVIPAPRHQAVEIAGPPTEVAAPVPGSRGLSGPTRRIGWLARGGTDLPTVTGAGQQTATVALAARVPWPDEPELGGHEVTAVAFWPAGDLLAVSDLAGHTYLCDPSTGQLAGDLTAELAESGPAGRGVEAMAFSPDGSLLAVGAVDGLARVWDLQGGALAAVLAAPDTTGVGAIAFSPDGSRLAVGDDGGRISQWQTSGWEPLQVLADPRSGGACSVQFSPDGSVLAVADGNGRVYVWAVGTGQLVATLTDGGAGEVLSVEYSSDGSVLASGHADGLIRLWSTENDDQLATLARRGAGGMAVFALAFRPGSLDLAAGYAPGGGVLWDAERGRVIRHFDKRDAGNVLAIAFSPDGGRLASGHDDGTARIWEVRTGRRLAVASIDG